MQLSQSEAVNVRIMWGRAEEGQSPRSCPQSCCPHPCRARSPWWGVRVQDPAQRPLRSVCLPRVQQELLQPWGEQLRAHTRSHTWPGRRWGCVSCHCRGDGDLSSSPPPRAQGTRGRAGGRAEPVLRDTCPGNSAWHHLGPL